MSSSCRLSRLHVAFAALALAMLNQGTTRGEDVSPKVDFSYAFGTPHRVTLARPDSGDKTLLDVQPGSLRMAWTYDNLAMPSYPPFAFRTPPTLWNIQITPQLDGKPFAKNHWARRGDMSPSVESVYEDPLGSLKIEAANGMTAALLRIELVNKDAKPHQVVLRCDSGSWGEAPAWLDPTQFAGDHLLAGFNDRADRVLILGLGANGYSLQADGMPPGPRNMVLVWNLKPHEKRRGWLVRPYRAFADDLPALRKHNWAQEMTEGQKEWAELLNRACKLTIPDTGVTNGYRACLADLFVMREPIADGSIIAVPGTEGYRAGNSTEPIIIAVALDQNGLHKESLAELWTTFKEQATSGCWSDTRGWMHTYWDAAGFKAWAAMEHFYLTQDKAFLAEIYPRMLASSRWQEKQRARSRTDAGKKSDRYGLMPRGFGDCGLDNRGDMYGIFIPHNIWSVFADRCSLEAARILGKQDDAKELETIYATAKKDLLAVIEGGAIQEKDYRWIPGVAKFNGGSCWGVLNVAFPCELLPANHELVTGTLKRIEANISKGGQPLHTGWMADGAWVAITLDNIAETHLARGNGDAAAKYFYSTLNHGTPLYTWCEERGQEPGTAKTSGDRQHLWTPVAVVRCLRDMMVMESGDGVNLALGSARHWLASGRPVGISNAPTHFGRISYRMRYDSAKGEVSGDVTFAEDTTAAWAVLHVRLPDGLRVKSVDAESKGAVTSDREGIRWDRPQGTVHFTAAVGK